MTVRSIGLSDTLYDYLLSVSLRESDLFKRLREETQTLEWSMMQIAPEQGQFMRVLIELIGASRVIEVGTFTGYSALCMASSLPEDGRLICCDVSKEWTDIARRYWDEAGVADKIDLRLAPARETLDALLDEGGAGGFDFAFIDADKPSYLEYYERCLSLLRPGGLVAIDNTLWSGAVADPANREPNTRALRVFNAFLHKDERVSLSLVPIGDGLSLARKR